MWNETNAQHDGTIVRNADRSAPFPATPEDWVLSGRTSSSPTPSTKPRVPFAATNGHYDPLDLETLPDDYLPRTNYRPMADRDEYLRRTPRVTWIGS